MASTPKTRREFWEDKFATNVMRDRRNVADLEQSGWRVATIWECETRHPDALRGTLSALLSSLKT
jgi:DNA mismatch endonuclease (patch repair protein)